MESIDTVRAQEKNALYVCVRTHTLSQYYTRITMKKILITHNLIKNVQDYIFFNED